MSLKTANKTTDFPIDSQDRTCTDVCCTFIGIAFSATLFILALFLFNYDHQIKTSFPSDSKGRVCGFDLEKFPFIYFANFPKTDRRVCVSQCPSSKEKKLNCFPTDDIGCVFSKTPGFEVGYYDNKPQITSIGSFCVPTDRQQRQQLYEDIHVQKRFLFFEHIKSIGLSCAFAAIVSLLFLLFVQCLPQKMIYATLVVGAIIIIITGVFVMVFPKTHMIPRIIFAAVLLLALIAIFFNWKNNKASLKFFARFVKYSTETVNKNCLLLVYIPLFLGILVVFMLGIGFQLKCLWSSTGVQFQKENVFYTFKGQTTLWSVLVFVQTVWGLAWIKEAFNFCISGNASEWYFHNEQENPHFNMFKPLLIVFSKHFGSVVAGSFMTGWFSIFDYVFDTLRSSESSPSEEESCTANNFFDLVRSDCFAYIYVTGNPYCNSSRYCQYLCAHSPLTRNSQSISRAYRICAHFLLAGIACIANIFLQGANISVFVLLVVFILSLFISTFFISFHADATEAIHIIFLMDEYFASREMGPQQRLKFSEDIVGKMKLNNSLANEISKIYQQNEEVQ